jgi:hypothetical protein
MIVKDLHIITDGLHIIPIYIDEHNFKVKIFSLKGKNLDQIQNQKVYIFPNCRRTYISPNFDSNFSKTIISSEEPNLYIKKSPLSERDFKFEYKTSKFGSFINTTQTTRNKSGWNSIIELFYSPAPIKSKMYKLSQIQDKVIKIDTFLYPHSENYQQNIPKLLIQTSFEPYENEELQKIYSQIWREYNPDYKYIYFSYIDCFKFMKLRYGEQIANKWNNIFSEKIKFLNKLKIINKKKYFSQMKMINQIKILIFKICIIAEIGGVYADILTYPYTPLKSTIQPETLVLLTKDSKSKRKLSNHFFAAVSKHKIMLTVRNEVLRCLMTDNTKSIENLLSKIYIYILNTDSPIIPLNLGKLIVLDNQESNENSLVKSLSDLLFMIK